MKKILLASAVIAAMCMPAPAQQIPTLAQFMSKCSRDTNACRVNLKDYVTAAKDQKNICLPEDVSVNEAVSATLRWLRSDETHPASLNDGAFDDGVFAATQALYACKEETPPPAPPADASAAPPADASAAPPADASPAAQPAPQQ